MTWFTVRPLRVAVSALMAAVMLLFTAVPSYAADPAPPGVSDVDWDRYSRELKGRSGAAKMPVKAGAQRTGQSFNTSSAMKRARATYAQRHVTTSTPATPAAPGKPATPGKVSTPDVPKPGPGAKKIGLKMAGGAAAAVGGVFGFNLAYEGTTSVMGGLFGLESDGFLCDIKSAFGNNACQFAAAPGYVPNEGVEGQPAGWALPYGNSQILNPGSAWTTGPDSVPDVKMTFDITASPNFGATTGTASFKVSMSGACKASGVNFPNGGELQFFGRNTSNGFIYAYHSVNLADMRALCAPASMMNRSYQNITIPAAQFMQFDHIEYNINNGRPLADRAALALKWYPQGHSLWTPGMDADPRRVWRTSWQCDVGGGAILHGSADSAPFFESDPEWPGFPEAVCDEGTLVEWHIDQISDGLDPLRMYEWTLPADVAEWASEYPQCANASCTLELQRLDKTTGKAVACFDSPDLCADWFTDPLKTENYQCVYAGEILALDECNLYAPTFSQKLGGGIADPVTGEKTDTTTTGPGTAPTDPLITQPGTSLWGSNNRPGNCPPPFSWSSLINPWWYYQGVKCALVETFVPAEPSAPFLAVANAWDDTRLGKMFVAWSGIFDKLRVTPSCSGPSFTWPASTAQYGLVGKISPFDSCSGWAAQWAPRINGALTWMAGAYFSLAIISTISRGFGYDMAAAGDTSKKTS